MFLNLLNDTQKNLFLDLAIKAADSSGGISEQEKNMLKTFAFEMQIPARYECNRVDQEIFESLKRISTKKELKIVVFEILGIMHSDSEYDDIERKYVSSMIDAFEIDRKTIEEMEERINNYSMLFNEICDIVLSE